MNQLVDKLYNMTSYQINNLVKKHFDKMTSYINAKLMNNKVDKVSHTKKAFILILMKWQFFKVASWQNDKIPQ